MFAYEPWKCSASAGVWLSGQANISIRNYFIFCLFTWVPSDWTSYFTCQEYCALGPCSQAHLMLLYPLLMWYLAMLLDYSGFLELRWKQLPAVGENKAMRAGTANQNIVALATENEMKLTIKLQKGNRSCRLWLYFSVHIRPLFKYILCNYTCFNL